MIIIVIVALISGVPHASSTWHEHYATFQECNDAIPGVALQFLPKEGVMLTFNCVREERGA